MDVLYADLRYGFSLRIPGWWERYLVIRRNAKFEDAAYAVSFRFKYRGKVYIDVMNVLVYRLDPKRWHEAYDDSPIVYMGHRDGLVFAYSVPSEPPEEFLNESKDDYDEVKYGTPLRLLRRMVNEDVPRIAKTLKFLPLTPPPTATVTSIATKKAHRKCSR